MLNVYVSAMCTGIILSTQYIDHDDWFPKRIEDWTVQWYSILCVLECHVEKDERLDSAVVQ